MTHYPKIDTETFGRNGYSEPFGYNPILDEWIPEIDGSKPRTRVRKEAALKPVKEKKTEPLGKYTVESAKHFLNNYPS